MRSSLLAEIACLACGSQKLSRVFATSYYPNKTFCPHEKEVVVDDKLLTCLGNILQDDDLRCRGCGIDGPEGSCSSSSPSAGCKTCT